MDDFNKPGSPVHDKIIPFGQPRVEALAGLASDMVKAPPPVPSAGSKHRLPKKAPDGMTVDEADALLRAQIAALDRQVSGDFIYVGGNRPYYRISSGRHLDEKTAGRLIDGAFPAGIPFWSAKDGENRFGYLPARQYFFTSKQMWVADTVVLDPTSEEFAPGARGDYSFDTIAMLQAAEVSPRHDVGHINAWPVLRKRMPAADLTADIALTCLGWVAFGIVAGDDTALEAARIFSVTEDEDASWDALEGYAEALVKRLDTDPALAPLRAYVFTMARRLATPHLPKPPMMFVLFEPQGGAGKSKVQELHHNMLGGDPLGALLGPEDIEKDFNSHLRGQLLLQVEELPAFASRSDRDGWWNKQKRKVSAAKLSFTRKGVDTELNVPNPSTWVFSTNSPGALPARDRRVVVLKACSMSGEQRQIDDAWNELGPFYAQVAAWVEGEGPAQMLGIYHRMADFFPSYAAWNPYERLPATAESEEMQERADPLFRQIEEVRTLIENGIKPFDKDFGKLSTLDAEMNTFHGGNRALPVGVAQLQYVLGKVGKVKQVRVGKDNSKYWFWRHEGEWTKKGMAEARGKHLVDGSRPWASPQDDDAEEDA